MLESYLDYPDNEASLSALPSMLNGSEVITSLI